MVHEGLGFKLLSLHIEVDMGVLLHLLYPILDVVYQLHSLLFLS